MNAITEIQNLVNEHAYLKDFCNDQAGKVADLKKRMKNSRTSPRNKL